MAGVAFVQRPWFVHIGLATKGKWRVVPCERSDGPVGACGHSAGVGVCLSCVHEHL